MKNLPLFFGVLFGTLVLVAVVAFAFTKKANAPLDTTRIVGDAHNATGSAQPKVTIVEFSDLQCPACRAARPLVQRIVQGNPDQVRLVYRHYPLVAIHKNSLLASQVAEVAASAGKFWPFHDLVFDKQDEWAELNAGDAERKLVEYAVTVGVPAELMQQGISQKVFDSRVTADMTDGDTLGVNSTPTFYVNGKQTEVSVLEQTVANALKE